MLGRDGGGTAVRDDQGMERARRCHGRSQRVTMRPCARSPSGSSRRVGPRRRAAARGLFRIRFEGVEHVPRAGAVVITPNHVSFMDPILVTIPVRRALHYMALEPFFRVRGLGALDALGARLSDPGDRARQSGHSPGTADPEAGRAARHLSRGGPLAGRTPSRRSVPARSGSRSRPELPSSPSPSPARSRPGRPAAVCRVPAGSRSPTTRLSTAPALPPGADRKTRPEILMGLVRERIIAALPV